VIDQEQQLKFSSVIAFFSTLTVMMSSSSGVVSLLSLFFLISDSFFSIEKRRAAEQGDALAKSQAVASGVGDEEKAKRRVCFSVYLYL